MRVLFVVAAVIFMGYSSPAFSQEELAFTAELPEGVPDLADWPSEEGILDLNISDRDIVMWYENDPITVWLAAEGVCPKDEVACGFQVRGYSSERIIVETGEFHQVIRIVVRSNSSGKKAECIGYWTGVGKAVDRQFFWLRADGRWERRRTAVVEGMDVLWNRDSSFALRMSALIKIKKLRKSEGME